MDVTERKALLKSLEGLRTTDISDGLDGIGLLSVCLVDQKVRPLWKDIQNFKHRIYGFAYTVRFLPTQEVLHASSTEEFLKIEAEFKRKYIWSSGWAKNFKEDDILCMEVPEGCQGSPAGSENFMRWVNDGLRGLVTNYAGIRDTDEVIKQELPVYCAYSSRAMTQGRMQYDAHEVPINIGGVLVKPGDLIVADNDGVVVVPIAHAKEVIEVARRINVDDRVKRSGHYAKAGMAEDFTTRPINL
ncbi:MAG: RraA family protein [Treponema sp.]|nr:RraA family protein [Treponema sp.]